MDFELPDPLTPEECAQLAFIWPKLKALTVSGLIGIDLTRCWVDREILPLSRHDALMCEYDSDFNNPQSFSNLTHDSNEVNKAMKKLLGETKEACCKIGLELFYT